MKEQTNLKYIDTVSRFLFDHYDIRGEIVNLQKTYEEILGMHNYPIEVQKLLGELLVSTCLLSATLKYQGSLTVQIQGDGPLKLAVINGDDQQKMKGIARVHGDIEPNSTFKQMIGHGQMVITIIPEKGERYQGIVALEGETLSECIENYFKQSEQLETKLFIKVGVIDTKPVASGLLLQKLPAHKEVDSELTFEHVTTLASTISGEEIYTLSPEKVLNRLYHEEDLHLFEPKSVIYCCSCSREKCGETLMSISQAEIDQILQEDHHINVHCDYCGSDYRFDQIDIEHLRQSHHPKITH